MLIATRGSKIDISSEKKTKEIAKKINGEIKPGDILFLYGEMGVGKTKARNTNTSPDYASKNKTPLSNKVAGHGPARESTQYTGDYIIGIGQMHKSNGVPITRKEDAVAIANMRR